MSLPEWKIISAYGAQILPHLPDRADVAVAEVDGDGACLRINPLGASVWGWKKGGRLPDEIVDMLRELPPETPRLLPVKPGGLLLLGLRSGRADGWILVGYPGEEEGASPGQTRFETLIENMPVMALRMASDGTVCYANAEAERMTGYASEEMIGIPFWTVAAAPEDRDRIRAVLGQALAQGSATVRVPFLTRSGTFRSAELHLFRAPEGSGAELEGVAFDVTEQKAVAEALFQSESLSQTFLEQSPIGMLHLDAEGRVTFENHPFRQIVGEEADDAWIGLNIFEISGLDAGMYECVREVLEKGEAFRGLETTFKGRGEAEGRRLVVHGSPIFMPGHAVVGGVLMIEDVTRERLREEELALRDRYGKAEGDLRAAALADPDENEFLSKAARILGEVSGADRVHVLLHNPVDDLFVSRSVWVRATARTDALRLRHGDFPLFRALDASERRHVHACEGEASARPLLALTGASESLWSPFFEAGRLGGFALFEHIGEGAAGWGEAERKLIDHLVGVFETLWAWVQVGNRYRQTVAAIDDGLFHFTFTEDGERHYLFATHQFEALVGHTPEALLERGPSALRWIEDLVHPADHALVRAHDEALRGGREHRVTYRVRRPDASTRWLREHATPHRDDAGYVTVSGILTDVTEQKTAEEVLLQAKQEAEASNRLKTAFIATMSHEIRTPLGAVRGFAELLAAELEECEAPLPPQIHEFVEAIQNRAQHLLTLVNDLFDLSNVEMGALSVQRAPLNLHTLLREAIEKVKPALERKKLTLTCDLDPANPVVVGDSQRVGQVLSNLLSNAVKFTEAGGVSVRTRRGEHEALVEVSDTGIGMAETYAQRLFTPFSQEDDWRSRRFEGAGLGLALVKRLLDLLGGRIEVESEKGRGTTFRVYLPAAHRTSTRTRPKRARPHS